MIPKCADKHPSTPGLPLRAALLRAALLYAGRGWPVIPLQPGGKHPLIRDWPNRASTDPREIHMWWNRWPEANIGILTGPESGILALDVDQLAGLDKLERKHGPLPATRRHGTGSGGLHCLYRYPAGSEIRNSAGKLGPGLDVRGAGGYIVAPPSATTRPYEVLNDLPLADAPEWLLEALRAPHGAAGGPERAPAPGPMRPGEPIPAGRRNQELFRVACSWRARGLEAGAILSELRLANAARCEVPLPEAELERIADSAARYEAGSEAAAPLVSTDTLEALAEIEEIFWRWNWRGMAGKTDRDAVFTLIRFGQRFGRLLPCGGIRIPASFREIAPEAAMHKSALQRAVKRLKAAGWLRQDNAARSMEKRGAFVLLPPARKIGTVLPRGALPVPVPIVRAPRLRWSAPAIRRLGKTAGAVIDALERAGGTSTDSQLAAHVGAARPRDLRRRAIARLEAAGVVECSGETVSLARDWRVALDREREAAGEVAATRRDKARYDRERTAYKHRHEHWPEKLPPAKLPAKLLRDVSHLAELPEPPPVDLWLLYARVNSRLNTRRGPGKLLQVFTDEVRLELDCAPGVMTALDPGELLLEAVV